MRGLACPEPAASRMLMHLDTGGVHLVLVMFLFTIRRHTKSACYR